MDTTKEDQKVGDLTVAELRQLIRDELKAVWEYIYALENQMPNPDEGKSLKAEFKQDLEAELSRPVAERLADSIPLNQVMQELELDE